MDRQPGHLPRDLSKVTASLHWVKLVGVGSLAVGKTCLIKHFCESRFSPSYQPTVGVDYGFKIQSALGVDLRVHLWDLSGGPEFLDVRNELYGASDAIFIVFDVTNRSSFDSIDQWQRELTKYAPGTPYTCLVGNKTDLRAKRVVNAKEAKAWASGHQMAYYETSCSSGEGVETMFNEILEAVVQRKGLAWCLRRCADCLVVGFLTLKFMTVQ